MNPTKAMLCEFANKRWISPEQLQPSKGCVGPPKNVVFLLHRPSTCAYSSPLVPKEVVSAIIAAGLPTHSLPCRQCVFASSAMSSSRLDCLLLAVLGLFWCSIDHVPGSYPGLHALCQLLKVRVNRGELCLDLRTHRSLLVVALHGKSNRCFDGPEAGVSIPCRPAPDSIAGLWWRPWTAPPSGRRG